MVGKKLDVQCSLTDFLSGLKLHVKSNRPNIYTENSTKPEQNTVFSGVYRIFCRIDHMIGYIQVLTNLRRLNSYQVSIPITVV